jgi:FdhD protein
MARISGVRRDAPRVRFASPSRSRSKFASAGRRFTLTMRTPGHDEDLAAGFLMAEGFVNTRGELGEIRRLRDSKGALDPNALDVILNVPAAGLARAAPAQFRGLFELRRLRQNQHRGASNGASRPLPAPPQSQSPAMLRLPAMMREAQQVFATTGGLHAAALFALENPTIQR